MTKASYSWKGYLISKNNNQESDVTILKEIPNPKE